jgi:D-tyrosyl-tRNA(Tyr) deacylase
MIGMAHVRAFYVLPAFDASQERHTLASKALFASTKKGNRPAYSRSARPEIAIPAYERLISKLTEDLGRPIQTGEFGADMEVTLTNDGPVTIIFDTKNRE